MPSIDTSSTSDSSTRGSASGAVVSTSGASLRVVSGMWTSGRTATGGMPRTLTRARGPGNSGPGVPRPDQRQGTWGTSGIEGPPGAGPGGMGSVVGTVATGAVVVGAVVVGAAVVRAVPTAGAVVIAHVVTDRVVGTVPGRAVVVTHVVADRVVGTVPATHPAVAVVGSVVHVVGTVPRRALVVAHVVTDRVVGTVPATDPAREAAVAVVRSVVDVVRGRRGSDGGDHGGVVRGGRATGRGGVGEAGQGGAHGQRGCGDHCLPHAAHGAAAQVKATLSRRQVNAQVSHGPRPGRGHRADRTIRSGRTTTARAPPIQAASAPLGSSTASTVPSSRRTVSPAPSRSSSAAPGPRTSSSRLRRPPASTSGWGTSVPASRRPARPLRSTRGPRGSGGVWLSVASRATAG